MKYSIDEVIQYVNEEDVKFIRLAFCDIYGTQKNISIMPSELPRAFEYGITIDASAIEGFGDERRSDLLLIPDPSTLAILPWRPEHGRVVRMFCSIVHSDGKPFEGDTRAILQKAIDTAEKEGIEFNFGSELEFYLFKQDEFGAKTSIPYDNAGYMDIAPDDKGENIRREICLTLEQMDIIPESSHHEEGPGQNEIDFRYSNPLSSADNTMTFETVVKTVANRNGLYADFSAKPMPHHPGNGFHINMSAKNSSGKDLLPNLIAGILNFIPDMTAFLNPTENSYERFGENKAPKYISWDLENRSALIRVPACPNGIRRLELRSPDPCANPYLAYALLIYAGIYGVKKGLTPPQTLGINLFKADKEVLKSLKTLPSSIAEAVAIMKNSEFIREHIPSSIIDIYAKKLI